MYFADFFFKHEAAIKSELWFRFKFSSKRNWHDDKRMMGVTSSNFNHKIVKLAINRYMWAGITTEYNKSFLMK